MLFLNRADVGSLLDPDQLIDRLSDAMVELSTGRASIPLRTAARVAERDAILAAMPGYLPGPGAGSGHGTLAAKLVSLFPRNAGTSIPTHQALIVVFDPATGTPIAVMDGELITALRTAAGSALATRLLARPEASVLAVVGTGVQARRHAEAIPRVRPIEEIRIGGRDPGRTEGLTRELEETATDGTFTVRACRTPREAVEGADIVCTTTHAAEPVLRRQWLSPGAHVNAVGVNPKGGELDADTIRDGLVTVEWRQAALAPFPSGAADLRAAFEEGSLEETTIAEIGEILTGARPGRSSPEQITIYRSVGVAVQDAAAASLVLETAHRRSAGTELAL